MGLDRLDAYDEIVEADSMSGRKAAATLVVWCVVAIVAVICALIAAGFAAHAIVRAAHLVWDLFDLGWRLG